MRSHAGGQSEVSAQGDTIGDVVDDIVRQFPGTAAHLKAPDGGVHKFVNVYVNDEDIRYLQKEDTPVAATDSVSIIPSVAGGAPSAGADLPALTSDEVRRYSRHLLLPEVGMDGQRALKAAKVLCVGAGGLGSPVAMYLAAAGVGTLGLVDFDVVDDSNLQRQILHGTPDVGRKKLDSARDTLHALNPYVHVETHDTALSSANALDLFAPYDIVVDGTDNFPTRYLVNDACVLLRKPNAYGSIFRFEGQASVFATTDGPCYRCLYPEPPPPGLVPSCAEGGVLGVLPGVIGTIQTLKLILGAGETLVGRFLIYDALRMRFRELTLRRDPECPVCGDHPMVTGLIDYEEFCGVAPATGDAAPGDTVTIDEMSVTELKRRLDVGEPLVVLDVREPHEYQISRIEGSVLIPLGELSSRHGELDPAAAIICQCRSGVRSAKATEFLRGVGFTNVRNLAGGILAWSDQVDPSQPKY
jgi:adenylyltransferase/sulfurtransferase